mmetsp:Transcript_43885/g.121437  ORF Transcript_43885/g.121437 Transcript_43885/m.121437 type:complete len:203 (+) Transcript_43885:892-1500(+)
MEVIRQATDENVFLLVQHVNEARHLHAVQGMVHHVEAGVISRYPLQANHLCPQDGSNRRDSDIQGFQRRRGPIKYILARNVQLDFHELGLTKVVAHVSKLHVKRCREDVQKRGYEARPHRDVVQCAAIARRGTDGRKQHHRAELQADDTLDHGDDLHHDLRRWLLEGRVGGRGNGDGHEEVQRSDTHKESIGEEPHSTATRC